jgi:hypothetical protein
LQTAQQHARREQLRAARAGAIADQHDRMLADATALRRWLHERMAKIHRDIQQTHQTAARIHTAYAARLQCRLDRSTEAGDGPLFMAAVADTLDAHDAFLNLIVPAAEMNAVAASSKRAAAVQELELVLDEGPAHTVLGDQPLFASSADVMMQRWPRYGPAVSELGFGSVSAMALTTPHSALGSLVVLDPSDPTPPHHLNLLRSVGAALTQQILIEFEHADPDLASSPLLGQTDYHDEVHQATGMIMVQTDSSAADALAMLKARAFAEGMTVGALAAKVVSRDISLGGGTAW